MAIEEMGCALVLSIVGTVKINSVSQGSNVQIGDAINNVLIHKSKNYAGSDSFASGQDFGSVTNNENSSTNTSDPDIIDN
jgi:spore germination protein PA